MGWSKQGKNAEKSPKKKSRKIGEAIREVREVEVWKKEGNEVKENGWIMKKIEQRK